MDIHFFEDAEGWAVHAEGSTRHFSSRREAFAEANRIARENAPSTVVRGAPAGASREEPGEAEHAPGGGSRGGPGDVVRAPAGVPAAGGPRAVANGRNAPAGASYGVRVDATVPSPVDWERLAGPEALGRSLLVTPGAEVPEPWSSAPRVDVAARVETPDFLGEVRSAFLDRRRTVYEVDADASSPRESLATVDVWGLDPGFELEASAAWELMVANAVDARNLQEPAWLPAGQAVAAGARWATPQDPAGADVVLPDGQGAICDGGPLRFRSADELGVPGGTVVLPAVTLGHGRIEPPGHQQPTAALAPDQLAAVGEVTACSRIVAPAGSGKTRVLTERARHLLADRRIPADALCLVAFNKRAQVEMVERTPDLPGLQVQTLNALALAVLNGGRGFRDRGERVRTIDESEVRRRLEDLVTFPRRTNTDPAAAWIDAFSAIRLGLRDPDEVEGDFQGDVEGLGEVFGRYRRSLRSDGVVDFDDQIYRAIEVLLAEPQTRAGAQHVCRLMLVDEFQDLTPAHLLLVRLLAGPTLDVFGVGDDDQTIYGYSGASPEWLVRYDRWFPGATHHALEVNYRCPAPVVEAASNLLSHNRHRVPKSIVAGPGAERSSGSLTVIAHTDPAAAAVERVASLVAAGVEPGDIAVLTRVNTLLAPVQVGLHVSEIPSANREGTRFTERTGVAAALAWMALATSGGRLPGSAIAQAARRPGRSISPRLIGWMSEQSDVDGLTRLAGRLNKENDADKVLGFAGDVERIIGRARGATTADLVDHVRNSLGLDRSVHTLDAVHRGRNATAHTDDLRALESLARLHPDPADFGRWLRDVLGIPPDPDGVQLAPVHRVKGLEWPHVVVCDASADQFPHHLSTDVEEERRVFHVAITRGRSSVWVISEEGSPSIFLDELREAAPPAPPAEGGSGTSEAPGARGAGQGTEFEAVVGMEVAWGGYRATIAEVGDSGAKMATGRATIAVAYGSTVEVQGRSGRLVAPARSTGARRTPSRPDEGDAHPGVLEALKAWRLTRSKADGVPAYVVADNKTLVAIATSLPASEPELLRVPGIGPTKLERYGDEILAVVDGERS